MRIDWQQELEGYSLLQIRDALRGLPFTDTKITPRLFSERLEAKPHVSERLLAGLVESGLVERGDEGFQLTDTGISLRAAHATRRFKRARADKAVAKLLQTAAEINANPIFLYDVSAVAVYGSYITDAADLGDIDVAVELKARWDTQARFREGRSEREQMGEKFEAVFPPPPSFYEKGWWRFWPETYTRRLLRTDPAMKPIELQELELIGCPHRVIFPEVRDVPAKPDWSFKREQVVLKTAAPNEV